MSDNSFECLAKHSPTLGQLAKALAKAQGAMQGAKKDALNPHFKSKYADLASTWDACRKALSENGLCVVQTNRPMGREGVSVITTLIHSESGEWMSGELFVPVSKQDAQGFGSALTYGRRYALAAMVGVAAEDDDGEGAIARGTNGGPVKANHTEAPHYKTSEYQAGIENARSMKELNAVYSAMVADKVDISSPANEPLMNSLRKRKVELTKAEKAA